MIIYIHGFGSSGQSGKANLFREYFKKNNIEYIAPSLSYIPELAVTTLEELINSYSNVSLIGSSLGGFYSIYLAEKYRLKAVLINPAVKSEKTLKKHIELKNRAESYYDGSCFEWRESHLDMLKKYVVEKPTIGEYLLMLNKRDEVLDYRDALEKLADAKKIIEEGGSHRFENIEKYLEKIREHMV